MFFHEIPQFLTPDSCNECGGKGKIVTSKCPVCKGKKVVRESEIIDVSIQRGMDDGDTIVSIFKFF